MTIVLASILIPPPGIREPSCDYCTRPTWLIAGHAVKAEGGVVWACFECDAWIDIHPDSAKLKPMGRLANAELRAAKHTAHEAFDELWKWGIMSRPDAYAWLSEEMGLPLAACHIGWFDVTDCKRVVAIMRDFERTMA